MKDTQLTSSISLTRTPRAQEIISQSFDLNKMKNMRVAQSEGFFAVLAHAEEKSRKIVVLPTGTGKTDLMIAIYAYGLFPGKLLILASSDRLRTQLKEKFKTLGCLVEKGILPKDIVAKSQLKVLALTPDTKSDDWSQVVDGADVVVTTPMLIKKRQEAFRNIAEQFSCLFVDEAHHVAAEIWKEVLAFFPEEKVLLFTATPFRNDKQKLGGKTIYTYSLKRAQEDKLYSLIELAPVFQLDPEQSDKDIAVQALEIFEKDRKANFDHKILARCDSIKKAYALRDLYEELAPNLAISVVTSKESKKASSLSALETQDVIICVDIFGEGVDCPAFKIAAIHSNKKSLGPLLQFVGRFVRTSSTSGKKLGSATMIFNQAEEEQNQLLRTLYQEDSDWNTLIPNLSEVAFSRETKQKEFMESFVPTISFDEVSLVLNSLSIPLSYEILSSLKKINVSDFFRDLENYCLKKGFLYSYQAVQNVFLLITPSEGTPDWLQSTILEEKRWDYTVLRCLECEKKDFVCVSSSASWSNNLARWLTSHSENEFRNFTEESIFRIFSLLSWPVVKNVGGDKEGHSSSSFQNVASKDISRALLPTEQKAIREKVATVYGRKNDKGWSLGASKKGKVWALANGGLDEWSEFVEETLEAITDDSLKSKNVLEYSKCSEKLTRFPDDVMPISIDFDPSLYSRSSYIWICLGSKEYSLFDAEFLSLKSVSKSEVEFRILLDGEVASFRYVLGGTLGKEFFKITPINSIAKHITFKTSYKKAPLSSEIFFEKYLPHVLFSDCSLLTGKDFVNFSSPIMEFPSQFLLEKNGKVAKLTWNLNGKMEHLGLSLYRLAFVK